MRNKPIRLIILVIIVLFSSCFIIWYFSESNKTIDEIFVYKPDCYPLPLDHYNVSDYKGVLTKLIYEVNLNNDQKDFTLSDEASTKATADLFSRFKEIPLKKLPDCVEEIYRLTWIPTFHAPTTIRIWMSDDEYFLTIKRLNGKGGYDLGNLEFEQTHSLTFEKWQQIQNSIKNINYWETSLFTVEPMLYDGAGWLLEGRSKNEYHYIYRRIPSKDLSTIFNTFFEFAELETEHKLYLK